MRISTFFFLTRRGLRNLGKHWAMTIACIASLSVCMTLNSFASLAEVNVDSMVSYLGSQNETVVYLDPDCDDATATQVGEKLSTMPGVSGVQYVSKQDVLNIYRGYMEDYSSLWDEFETDNPFKANYRVTISDLSQMAAMSKKMQAIPGRVQRGCSGGDDQRVRGSAAGGHQGRAAHCTGADDRQHHHRGQHHPPERVCPSA